MTEPSSAAAEALAEAPIEDGDLLDPEDPEEKNTDAQEGAVEAVDENDRLEDFDPKAGEWPDPDPDEGER